MKKERTYRRDGRQHLTPRADGRYQLRVDGRRIYGRTEDEVYEKADALRAQLAAGEAERQDPTVQEFGDRWIRVAKAGVTDKVYDDYAGQMSRLYKAIGDRRVREVGPLDIKDAFNGYLGMSASTIRRARMLWMAMFDAAIAEGIRGTNPVKAQAARPHKGTAGTHRSITNEERDLIWRVQHPMRLMALVMLYTGLRRGEALAIDLGEDYDPERQVIRVSKAIRYESNKAILADPKTEAGAREVPVPGILAKELKGKTGLLFQAQRPTKTEKAEKDAKPYATEQAFSRGWESWLNALSREANGGMQRRWWGKTREHKAMLAEDKPLPEYKEIRIRPHDLRHSYATTLRDAGVDLRVAMRWMGHADVEMLLRIYDHPEARMRANMDRLDAWTGGTEEKKQA